MRVAFVLIILLLQPVAGAEAREGSDVVRVPALAVSQTAEGHVGIAAQVQVQVLGKGDGSVFVATRPLAETDMQGSAALATRVAAATIGVPHGEFDYLVRFESPSSVIGGPSAGAVMALALAVALQDLVGQTWQVDPQVAATGTINADGTIGPVGGVPAKAKAAAEAGMRLFLYPAGQEKAVGLVAGPFGPRQVLVDMDDHCQTLGLMCRSVATVAELIEASTGVRLTPQPAPVPGTADYGEAFEQSVDAELVRLEARIAALPAVAVDDRRAEELAASAAARAGEARTAFASAHYYLAATRAFQGHIDVGRLENLTSFYDGGRVEDVVLAALHGCQKAVAAVEQLAAPRTANAMHALGAAQVRVAEARVLADQAETFHTRARTHEDWVQSLFASAFCHERARTVAWWADLASAFPAGPSMDVGAVARAQVEAAAEHVGYAMAVGQSGAAAGLLEEAEAWLEPAPAAAIVRAAEAAAAAGVALQTGSQSEVPTAVLEAAAEGAARAVAAARAAGIEPIISVSLIELSREQEPATALASLWTARTLALVDAAPAPATPWTPPDATWMPALYMGMVLGAAAVAVVVALVPGRR